MKRLLLLALASPLALSAQSAVPRSVPRVLEVPGAYATIQLAIDSAKRGDTVLVAPGRYYENIRFKGKGIVVTSHFARTRDLGAITSTIIDGSRPSHPDTGSVVRVVNQEDTTTVLQGFTITGGTGTVWLDAKDKHYFREGGGILCDLSSPTIRYNHVVGNVATSLAKGARGDSVLSAGGGGIRCGYAEPMIVHNVIRGNGGRYGAGVVLFHSAGTVRNNLVAENVGGEDFGGAGLWVVGSLSYRLETLVEQNTIVRNRSRIEGAAKQQGLKGVGGGVWTSWTRMVFRHNIVWGNEQAAHGQFEFPPEAPLEMRDNLIDGGVTGAPDGHATIDIDPRFRNPVRFELSPGSPALRGGGRHQLGAYGGPLGAPVMPEESGAWPTERR